MARSNEETEQALRTALEAEGYSLSPKRGYGETGVDILATRGEAEQFAIEVIGAKRSPPARARDFFEGFFRAISRLDQCPGAACVLAMPWEFQAGARQRRQNYGSAWDRIGEAFPELQIWFVDCDEQAYRPVRWNDFGRENG